MAPVLDKLSPLVTAEVTIAGVKVVALLIQGPRRPVAGGAGMTSGKITWALKANRHFGNWSRKCACRTQRHNPSSRA